MSFNPVWNDSKPNELKNPISTYWESLSTFIVIALFLVWPTLDKKQIMRYLPSLIIFIISSLFRYQPSALDNLKVIFPAWFPYAVCAVSHFISTMFSISFRKRHFIFIISLFVVVLCFNTTTVYHIYKFMSFKFPIYDIHTKELGLWVAENTRYDSKFLCSSWMTNPITSLAGREVTIGYFGWIWTHGLNITERLFMMSDLAKNPYNYSSFKEKSITYAMYRENDETREFLWKQPIVSSKWIEILDLGGYKLYRLID
ncbi:hypothetical protein TVAG_232850 [Trichomonas vaginalis G3]|uniref:Mannosyltransferase n=1 Tax=Trichomonas vaginalis (strain ATCC PRA-98 / G3) TaxID=412133 RepID=A2FVZ9_TRIV3|nr:hypothetical protein TVAGG3_0492100 [Trichomonas vaginalis G3]EAX90928.1 hypothetical protein TVAG_232850 [Trichomonas vaginalis G3]KAI5516458.1 hypothetical protein TVAGG3_0492100 [Trichomonas vaginalis G3]|eukprot:XP_001303858.1 hypothetical protein [Trichomonas vaginalis G3]